MTRKTFLNMVAGKVDTKKQKIDVSITYRVGSIILNELNKMSLKDLLGVFCSRNK